MQMPKADAGAVQSSASQKTEDRKFDRREINLRVGSKNIVKLFGATDSLEGRKISELTGVAMLQINNRGLDNYLQMHSDSKHSTKYHPGIVNNCHQVGYNCLKKNPDIYKYFCSECNEVYFCIN